MSHTFLETTVVRIELTSGKKLFVISAYGRTTDSSQFNAEFDRLFIALELSNLSHYYIIAGDLNARHRSWMDRVNNMRGNTIFNWLNDYGMEFRCQLQNTRVPTFERGESFLDIAAADARITFHSNTPSSVSRNHDEFGLLLLPFEGDLIYVRFTGHR